MKMQRDCCKDKFKTFILLRISEKEENKKDWDEGGKYSIEINANSTSMKHKNGKRYS